MRRFLRKASRGVRGPGAETEPISKYIVPVSTAETEVILPPYPYMRLPVSTDFNPVSRNSVYAPLQDPKRQIGLLYVPRRRDNDHDDRISCSISTYDFDKAPYYGAISYTWGAPATQKSIFIDGKAHYVQPNAYEALRQARLYGKHRYLWIDTVCINQQDPVEKGHQIDFMRSICGKGASVLVSLARYSSSSHLPHLPHLFYDADLIRGHSMWENSDPTDSDLHEFIWEMGMNLSRQEFADEMLDAMHQFHVELRYIFRHPYWSRVWTVQELFASEGTIIMIADRHFYARHLGNPHGMLYTTAFRHIIGMKKIL
jgi:hypothetical protein